MENLPSIEEVGQKETVMGPQSILWLFCNNRERESKFIIVAHTRPYLQYKTCYYN
jgi:hypothetical protein